MNRLLLISTLIVTLSACNRSQVVKSSENSALVVESTGVASEASSKSSTQSIPYYYPNQGSAINVTPGSVDGSRLAEFERWTEVSAQPFSTVSVDVDTASYSRARLVLRSNYLPEPESIRVEDFINYFDYDYPAPSGDEILSLSSELITSPWNDSRRLLSIGIKTRSDDLSAMAKNLVFLIDTSGSMADENKLPLLKAALSKLADTISEQDRIAIVTYAGSSEILLGPSNDKALIKQKIALLGAGGGTNGSLGITTAYELAASTFKTGQVNRVVLATDGDFNLGISNAEDLVSLVQDKAKQGIFLTVLGFGLYGVNDSLMEKFSNEANGNYFFIDTSLEADKALGRELQANIVTLAKDVKVQIEFNPRLVKSYRLIGYVNRRLADGDFNNDKKDAGDLGSGHSVTYLYEIIPNAEETAFTSTYKVTEGVDPLLYQDDKGLTLAAANSEISTFKLRYKKPEDASSQLLLKTIAQPPALSSPSLNVQLQMAAASFALKLAGVQSMSTPWEQMNLWLLNQTAADPFGIRAEMKSLFEKAQALKVP